LAEIVTGKPYSRKIQNSKIRNLVNRATSQDPEQRPTLKEFISVLRECLGYTTEANISIEDKISEIYIDGKYDGKTTTRQSYDKNS